MSFNFVRPPLVLVGSVGGDPRQHRWSGSTRANSQLRSGPTGVARPIGHSCAKHIAIETRLQNVPNAASCSLACRRSPAAVQNPATALTAALPLPRCTVVELLTVESIGWRWDLRGRRRVANRSIRESSRQRVEQRRTSSTQIGRISEARNSPKRFPSASAGPSDWNPRSPLTNGTTILWRTLGGRPSRISGKNCSSRFSTAHRRFAEFDHHRAFARTNPAIGNTVRLEETLPGKTTPFPKKTSTGHHRWSTIRAFGAVRPLVNPGMRRTRVIAFEAKKIRVFCREQLASRLANPRFWPSVPFLRVVSLSCPHPRLDENEGFLRRIENKKRTNPHPPNGAQVTGHGGWSR